MLTENVCSTISGIDQSIIWPTQKMTVFVVFVELIFDLLEIFMVPCMIQNGRFVKTWMLLSNKPLDMLAIGY